MTRRARGRGQTRSRGERGQQTESRKNNESLHEGKSRAGKAGGKNEGRRGEWRTVCRQKVSKEQRDTGGRVVLGGGWQGSPGEAQGMTLAMREDKHSGEESKGRGQEGSAGRRVNAARRVGGLV